MKIPYYFGMAVMLLVANTSYSYSSYIDTNLVEQIKPNLMAGSKPTYPKFAAVSFLKSTDVSVDFKGSLDVKSQCGALGYVVKVDTCTSKTGKLNGVSGNYFEPSKLCSDDDSIKAADKEEAKKYTTGCCDSRIYTAEENEECPHNAAKLSNDICYWGGKNKYRCACDRGRYQYSTIQGEQCGSSFDSFNVNLACSAYEPRTEKTEMYFISCCPSGYSKCNDKNHEVGKGNECRVIDSKANLALVIETPALKDQYVYPKYENCVCAPHYDKECPSGQVIDGNLKCIDRNEKIWTPESNCESNCSKTIETNIDSYLYRNSWHCLYRKDGAIIRDDEDKDGVCGIFNEHDNTGSYDECSVQGFTKSEADCYNAETILRCPNDTTKVWCLEGKYCTGYNVGGTLMSEGADVSVCEPNKDVPGFSRTGEGSNAANVEFCPSYNSDYGWRCRYKYDAPIGKEDCNKCWNDGTFNPGAEGCIATDAENIQEVGVGSKCCNDGYYMKNGVCTKNTCSPEQYPYDIRPPYDAGDVVECREGDPTIALGYRAYFGYKSCNSDASKGEMWIEDPANNRRCICARNGEGGRDYYLPFTLDEYYISNGDNEAPGFNAGYYGRNVSCTDADGSYYGYTMCYIGREMKADSKCYRGARPDNYSGLYPTEIDTTKRIPYYPINAFLYWNGLETISEVTFDPRSTDASYCVNKYTHCEARDGTQLGDPDVCAMVPAGCNEGIEAACNSCYHPISVIKGEDDLYHLNDKFQVNVLTYYNTEIHMGITKCPEGTKKAGSTNSCYKYCYHHDMSKCAPADILAYCPSGNCESGVTLAPEAVKIGIVVQRVDNSLQIKYLKKTSDKSTYTWDEAQDVALEYVPDGCNDVTCQSLFGKGKWSLAPQRNNYTPISGPYYRNISGTTPRSTGASFLQFTLSAEGYDNISKAFWTKVSINTERAYRATRGDVSKSYLKSEKYGVEYFTTLTIQ